MQATHADPAQVHAMMTAMVPFFLFFGLVGTVVMIIPFWQIFKKAGFSPVLSLLLMLPVVNLIVLYVIAFSQWRVVPAGPDYPAYPYPPVPAPGYVPPTAYAAPPSYPAAPNYPPPPPTDPQV